MGMTKPATPASSPSIAESDLPTSWLVRIVLQCYTSDDGYPMWREVSYSEESAREYYYGTLGSDEERRSEAACILDAHGWTRHMICRVYS